jgi:hypothetical protein
VAETARTVRANAGGECKDAVEQALSAILPQAMEKLSAWGYNQATESEFVYSEN